MENRMGNGERGFGFLSSLPLRPPKRPHTRATFFTLRRPEISIKCRAKEQVNDIRNCS